MGAGFISTKVKKKTVAVPDVTFEEKLCNERRS